MFKVAVASLRSNKLRLLLTSFAIVIGVAFVAGSFVLTDTITARFDLLLGDISAGTDVYVNPPEPDFGNDFGQVQPSMPQSVEDDVAAVEGVAASEAGVGGLAQIIDKDGEPIGGQGPPTLAFSWSTQQQFSPLRIADGDGRPPEGPDEVVIDLGTAKSAGFQIGDSVNIVFNGPEETFTIVGLAGFGDEDNLAGATLSVFEFSEAQRLLGLENQISQISVAAEPDVTPDELVSRIQPVLPDGATAITVTQSNADQSAEIQDALGFLTIGLLAFAAIAVFVGAFIISNTFRIIVAQRTRELALLRAVGATASQVTRMVVLEAFIVALISSIIGVAAGVLLAMGLQAFMRAAGLGLPDGPLTLLPRTAIIGILVGVIVTVVSAILPARKASRIPPVAAMTADLSATTRKSLRTRMFAGIAVSVVGAAMLGLGLFGSIANGLWFVALGALTVFVGVSILAPLFARPLASVIGWPLPKLFGVPGELAVQNTRRQPRRTASTASALMIGVALVVFVAIFGSSIKTSVAVALSDVFPADITVSSTNFSTGVSPDFTEELRAQPEIGQVSAIGFTQAKIDADVFTVSSIEPDTVSGVFSFGISDESLAAMAEQNGLLVSIGETDYEAWIGRTVSVEMPNGVAATGTVVGTFDADNFGEFLITRDRYVTGLTTVSDSLVAANAADGFTAADAQATAIVVAEPYPTIEVQTTSEVLADAETQIDQLLAIFSVMLGLAIIIAVLGITNTLALSIMERTREIGLLRAVGMTRRQVRRMIRWEAVVIAIFGAVMGIFTGLLLGWAVVRALADEGLGTFSVPFGQLVVYIVIAGIAGIIAAIYPARKAARLNILEAIAYE
jgi:putative ABC transport system permease protein